MEGDGDFASGELSCDGTCNRSAVCDSSVVCDDGWRCCDSAVAQQGQLCCMPHARLPSRPSSHQPAPPPPPWTSSSPAAGFPEIYIVLVAVAGFVFVVLVPILLIGFREWQRRRWSQTGKAFLSAMDKLDTKVSSDSAEQSQPTGGKAGVSLVRLVQPPVHTQL